MKKIKWSKGFTLIELMIVVAVAGLMVFLITAAVQSDQKHREEKAAAYSDESMIVAHTNGHAYHNAGYWNEVLINASDDSQPVCVHGIPAFIARRGNQAGQLILLNDQRGLKAANRWWAACREMGNTMVERYQEDQ